MYWDGILGRPPVTAEDWAHVILAGVPGFSTAAPDDVYEPTHSELVEIIHAVQEQAKGRRD
jgi:hypothetical protein